MPLVFQHSSLLPGLFTILYECPWEEGKQLHLVKYFHRALLCYTFGGRTQEVKKVRENLQDKALNMELNEKDRLELPGCKRKLLL